MDTNSSAKLVADSCGGGVPAPRRPHWRHRDRSATAVYVVHLDQFRAVVHQLTGAAAPPPSQQPAHGRPSDNCNAHKAAPMAVETTKSKSGSMEQRTLAQMHHECMAWADEY